MCLSVQNISKTIQLGTTAEKVPIPEKFSPSSRAMTVVQYLSKTGF